MDYLPPPPIAAWIENLPSENVGTLYATVKAPGLFGRTKEYKVPVWGQVCDGQPHKDAVNLMMYNEFPDHGKGYIFISWRAEPNNPAQNKHPREGKVENPKPYSGVAWGED